MSFFRHGEIYHYDEGATPQDHALAHRNDEFPAGYSSAGCSPAEPASASPAGAIILEYFSDAKKFAVNGKLSPVTVSQPRSPSEIRPHNSTFTDTRSPRSGFWAFDAGLAAEKTRWVGWSSAFRPSGGSIRSGRVSAGCAWRRSSAIPPALSPAHATGIFETRAPL